MNIAMNVTATPKPSTTKIESTSGSRHPRFFQNISPCISAPPIIRPRHSVKKVNGMLPFQCFGASVDGSIVGDLRWELPAENTR